MLSLPHLDILQLVESAGYFGLFGIVFAESGLFFGFFLPGDSLLFTAGLLSSQGFFSPWILVPWLFVAAALGDSVGYWFGARVGPALFSREDSLFFKKRHLERTHDFYAKYGPRAVVLARFVPVVRTFAPIFAGIGQMRYGAFLLYNVLGSALWVASVTLAGFFLGRIIPDSERYILPLSILVIVLSFLPLAREYLYSRKRARQGQTSV